MKCVLKYTKKTNLKKMKPNLNFNYLCLEKVNWDKQFNFLINLQILK